MKVFASLGIVFLTIATAPLAPVFAAFFVYVVPACALGSLARRRWSL